MSYFVTIKNLKIHVVDLNPECDTALIFVHGRCLSEKIWEKQMLSPEFSGYRMIAFDLPGHGQSDFSNDPLNDYSLQGGVRVLEGLISELNLKSFALVGMSLGGHIALQSFSRFPECLGIFAMTMPIAKPIRLDLMFLFGDVLGSVFKEGPSPDDVSVYLGTLLSPQSSYFPGFLRDDFYKTDVLVHEGLMACVVADDYLDETAIFQQGDVPIAIVLGIEERLNNLNYLSGLTLPHVWRGEVIKIPDAGHCANWENPEAINTLLKEFVEECKDYSRLS